MNHPRKSVVYLIPSFLDDTVTNVLPLYIVDAVRNCQVFFVENERSARRYLKAIWKDMIIDDYEWFLIDKHAMELTANNATADSFRKALREAKNVGVISEAGCPGIADPGQQLVEIAHKAGAEVKPLVGPSSIVLALMASGMNGQQFQFVGYLPIDNDQRIKALKDLEQESARKKTTQIFIETPYRNNQLFETITKTCNPSTRLCIAADLTSENEFIKTKSISDWKSNRPDLHKKPVVFVMYAG